MAVDVGQQILDLKAAYESSKAQGASQSALDAIHQQAVDLRTQSGIKDSDVVYGNNNGVDPVRQNEMTQALIAARNQPTQVHASQAPVQQGMSNAQSYIDQLTAAKQQAQIAALGKSRDSALSNLNQEKSAIQPKYYDAKNQVASGAQQSARNFAEYMAARGGASAGSNAQATLMNNMSTQGNLGSLGRQETQAYGDIGRRMTDVQNAYASDVASTTAGGEADKMQALLNDYYQQQQRELQVAQLTGILGGQQTLAAKSQDQNYGLNLAGLSGQLPGGGQTLAAQGQAFNQNMQNKQFEYGQVQDAIKNGMTQQQIDNAAKQFAEQMGFNYANMNANDKQAWAQIAISQQNANTSSANSARLASNSNSSSNANKISTAQFNDMYSTLQQKYGVVNYKKDSQGKVIADANGNPTITYTNTNNTDQKAKIVADVLASGLSDDQTLQLLNKMGITEAEARDLLGG